MTRIKWLFVVSMILLLSLQLCHGQSLEVQLTESTSWKNPKLASDLPIVDRDLDHCFNPPPEKLFCMGAKGLHLTIGPRNGCFRDHNCDYFVSSSIIVDNIQHRIYVPRDDEDLKYNHIKLFFSDRNVSIPLDLDLSNITYAEGDVDNDRVYQKSHFKNGDRPKGSGNAESGHFDAEKREAKATTVMDNKKWTKYVFRTKTTVGQPGNGQVDILNDQVYPYLIVLEHAYNKNNPNVLNQVRATVLETLEPFQIFDTNARPRVPSQLQRWPLKETVIEEEVLKFNKKRVTADVKKKPVEFAKISSKISEATQKNNAIWIAIIGAVVIVILLIGFLINKLIRNRIERNTYPHKDSTGSPYDVRSDLVSSSMMNRSVSEVRSDIMDDTPRTFNEPMTN